jgi:hypothetical protein
MYSDADENAPHASADHTLMPAVAAHRDRIVELLAAPSRCDRTYDRSGDPVDP